MVLSIDDVIADAARLPLAGRDPISQDLLRRVWVVLTEFIRDQLEHVRVESGCDSQRGGERSRHSAIEF